MEKENTLCKALKELRAVTANTCAILVQQSPTAPLHQMLQCTNISQQPQPQPNPQMGNPFRQGQMHPGNLFYNVQLPPTPHTQPTFRTNDLCLADACKNVLPHHPDTPAGKTAYIAQIAAWNVANPGRMKENEYCPYPLTPGMAPIASNKCFGCGHVGHRANKCPTPGSLPNHERGWHAMAAIIYRVIRARGPAPVVVNYIASPQQWDQRQQWFYQDPSMYYGGNTYGDQGNGEGPSE